MTVLAAPFPSIVSVFAKLGRALVSVIVPFAAAAKVIVLVSTLKFAALIASRSVQPPGSVEQNPSSVSAVVFTTSDAGGASSFRIVSVVGFGDVIVSVSVGFDNVMITVSSAS